MSTTALLGAIRSAMSTSTTDPISGEVTVPRVTADPSIEDLQVLVAGLLEIIRARYGERAAAVLMVGVPVAGGHDRFAAHAIGPCIAARGLLEWGTKATAVQIAAFRNPADPTPVRSNGVVIVNGEIRGSGTIQTAGPGIGAAG